MNNSQKLREAAMKVFPKSAELVAELEEEMENYEPEDAYGRVEIEKRRMAIDLMKDGMVYRMQGLEKFKQAVADHNAKTERRLGRIRGR